jgi:hypothetical protein
MDAMAEEVEFAIEAAPLIHCGKAPALESV